MTTSLPARCPAGTFSVPPFLPERRHLMQVWADYLDRLKTGEEIKSGTYGAGASHTPTALGIGDANSGLPFLATQPRFHGLRSVSCDSSTDVRTRSYVTQSEAGLSRLLRESKPARLRSERLWSVLGPLLSFLWLGALSADAPDNSSCVCEGGHAYGCSLHLGGRELAVGAVCSDTSAFRADRSPGLDEQSGGAWRARSDGRAEP